MILNLRARIQYWHWQLEPRHLERNEISPQPYGFKRASQTVDMTDNDTAALVAVSLFGALASLAFTVNAIARAWVARGRDEARLANETATPLADLRLARLEQAVDAIGLEIERISESQRFTAKLLSEHARSVEQEGVRPHA
jgi:hypothetical protein